MSQFEILEKVWATPLVETIRTEVGPVATIGEYFTALMLLLWQQEDEFSGKRPFGNSDWSMEVDRALIKAGLLEEDEWGFPADDWVASQLVREAIKWNMGTDR